MTGLSVAVPNAPMIPPSPTGPTFNVFVLQPLLVLLQETVVGGAIQLSWPANSANWVMQFTPGLSPLGTWTDVTSAPAVVGGPNGFKFPNSGNPRSHRLA